ncbi:Protein of unknown function (DUF1679) [Nesidiocoris tenuis]|uniref:CHK kinase-like domain-containing protein n=1 Tax=Nesidiocoris tenuis TaxID=355587 RepID=A0ABN7AUC3_9HEMI|nr:Protein of unknown function (DUF1679) [Nesidiocoris tenuis]
METNQGLDTKWLGRLLKKRFHDDKPVDVVSVNVESAVPKGENYTSDVSRVKITTLTGSGATKTFSMIVKLPKTSKETQQLLAEYSVFRGESKMYSSILKHMEDLMDEFNDKREILWAKLYGFKPYNNMVLEDLKDQNYMLMDRKGWLGLDHALLVLRSIGRYHAMTKALISRGLIGPDDKGNFWARADSSVKDKMIKAGFSVFGAVISKNAGSWTSEWNEMGKRLQALGEKLPHVVGELYENYDKRFEVLNHGDLWSSNMMFKLMEYTDIPISVKLLDFQLPHLNSFIWDVAYFIHVSVMPSVRRVHKDRLLKAYHQSFSENLKFFQYDGYIPTIEDIISEETRMRPVALVFLGTIMPITTASVNDAFIMDKLMSDNPEDAFNEDIYSEEKFVKEVSDDLKEFKRLEII